MALILATAVGLIIYELLAVGLVLFGRNLKPNTQYEAIVIVGCRVKADGSPSRSLVLRCQKASALFHQGLAKQVIVSGGCVGHPTISEASCAQNILIQQGVPSNAILLEEESKTTQENAARLSTILNHNAPILIVSHAYHLFRVGLLFRPHFLNFDRIACDSRLVHELRGANREVAALIWTGIRQILSR